MKKIFSILVLISILFTSISCGGNVPDKINETNEINDKSTSTETESNEPILEIPKGSNFNDETFTMISYDPDVVNWNYVALDTDEVNGEILNDSLYNRNRKIEEELNIKLKYVTFKDVGQFPKEFIKSVSSGTNDFDIALMRYDQLGIPISEGAAVELNNFEYLDMSKPWWRLDSAEALSICGKMCTIDSYIGYASLDDIWLYFYNKKIVEDYNLGNLYDLVRSGKWTFEKAKEMQTQVTMDLDGDGIYDQNDRLGLFTNDENVSALLISSGLGLAKTDKDGIPYTTTSDEYFEKVFSVITDYILSGNDTRMSYETEDQQKMFRENQVLFLPHILKAVRNFREMDADFGLLPVPKYDESIKDIKTYVAASAPLLLIPISMPPEKFDQTSIILESLAYWGYKIMLPSYIDISVIGKAMRDKESEEMLDLIIDGITYDIGMAFNWANMLFDIRGIAAYKSQLKTPETITTYMVRSETKINRAIQKTVDAINNLN